MLYEHYSLAPWIEARWPNFSPRELACPRDGEFWYSPYDFDCIQRLRTLLNRPVYLNSAHRSRFHNRLVGGATNSEHLRIAFDIHVGSHDRSRLLQLAREAGFTSFGFYQTFLHCDTRLNRRWITKRGKIAWTGLVTYSASGRVLLPEVSLAS